MKYTCFLVLLLIRGIAGFGGVHLFGFKICGRTFDSPFIIHSLGIQVSHCPPDAIRKDKNTKVPHKCRNLMRRIGIECFCNMYSIDGVVSEAIATMHTETLQSYQTSQCL